MNRIRCTKLTLLAVFLGLLAYLLLKDESICITINGVHDPMTAREIAALLQEDEKTEKPWTRRTGGGLSRLRDNEELEALEGKQQSLLEHLIEARKTEEELKKNIIRLTAELRNVHDSRGESELKRLKRAEKFNLPTVFVITPTFKRFVQKAELTRVYQALKPVKNLHWIVVEDAVNKTDLVANFLRTSGLKYTHLNVRTPDILRRHPNEMRRMKPRGVVQRNLGIQWLRENIDPHKASGVIYFADDDNTYDSKIFDEMRWIQGVGVWPVAFTGAVRWAGPLCKNGKVVGFHAKWGRFRPFPIDMAAFAVNLKKLLIDFPNATFVAVEQPGMLESSLLSQITKVEELEPITPDCSKVMMICWVVFVSDEDPFVLNGIQVKRYQLQDPTEEHHLMKWAPC